MARYIDAETAKDMIYSNVLPSEGRDDAMYAIDPVPSADVQEVKHGKWILQIAGLPEYCYPFNEYQCSCCGYGDVFSPSKNVPYCWHCGAKMDGVEAYSFLR